MRAVVLRNIGGPEELRLETISDPTPSDEDCVVRVRAAAVCGRDLIDRRGGFPAMKLPTVLGHEFAGEIERVGRVAAERGFVPGDRVLNLHRPSCGACRSCTSGRPILCERAWQSLGHTIDGAYAELVSVHHGALVRIPESVPFDAASTLMCTAGVALQALRTRGRVERGEIVLVTGASGGVGVAAIQLARWLGATVIAVTTSPSKEGALVELGVDHVLVCPDCRFHEEARRLTGGRGVDVAVELTGSATFGSSIRSLRRGGRLIVVGNLDAAKVDLNLGAMIVYGLEIVGSASCTREDLEDVLSLVRTGIFAPRIDRTLPLDRAQDAHRLLAERSVFGRVVLVP